MRDERETRQKLLVCAKKEFMDKGYTQASLRSICKQAEVTTGALYFFFRDKADLFTALVEEPVDKLYQIMMNHYREEMETTLGSMPAAFDGTADIQAAMEIVHFMYQHRDVFQLVLMKSQGSGYESCMDRFVEITQAHYKELIRQICRQKDVPPVDDYMIHWVSHMQIYTFAHMITHEESEEKACKHIKPTIGYLMGGFFGMLKS